MEEQRLEIALIYGAYDYENSTCIKAYEFKSKEDMKVMLGCILASEDVELYKIEIASILVDLDNDEEQVCGDMICEIDYQKYLEHKDFIEGV